MKIIDFEKKGNIVRFYLGKETPDWGWVNPNYKDWNNKTPDWLKPVNHYYGDDWDDRNFEDNAGMVYPEFIYGYTDVIFPFDSLVLDPSNDYNGSSCCKDDMVARRVPCIIEVPFGIQERKSCFDYVDTSFRYWVGSDQIKKYYFGDDMEAEHLVNE